MKSYADIAGDGGSRVVEQIEALHGAIGRALAGVDRIVAVGSGKGGVGKSTLTAALAHTLAAAGEAVAILDADFNGPTQAQMAGLQGAPWVPGERGLGVPRRPDGVGVVSLGSVLPAAGQLEFPTVSRGEQHTWRATRELAMLSQLVAGVAWGRLDWLLLDLPPGAERTVQYAELLAPLAADADSPALGFVIVTIPSDLARGVVARSLTALAAADMPALGYVENMAGYRCPGCGALQPLFPESARALDAPLLGSVPFDPEVAALCDRGWPAADGGDAPWLAPFAAIAERLRSAFVALLPEPQPATAQEGRR